MDRWVMVEVDAGGRTGSNATSDTGYMQLSVGKFPKEIAAEVQAGRGGNGKHNGEGILGNIGDLSVGITAKAGAGETGKHGEAESAHRVSSHGLNMGQFAKSPAAGQECVGKTSMELLDKRGRRKISWRLPLDKSVWGKLPWRLPLDKRVRRKLPWRLQLERGFLAALESWVWV
ncbi:hypothetical protein FRX31_026067 [Thalictrum thalictroides]|uniref:Uncharacterized protein n=1 Tax=Thalictrum thalictroides TaxID=46969 RepID=A0A7J6VGV6_THATH|nr:hypothetical protein FRX31_026067 [Thalictrum thalictroides]